MDFDKILRHTGHICPYIVLSICLLSCFNLSVNVQNASVNFVSPRHVEHWCYVPSLQHLSLDQQKYVGIPSHETLEGGYDQCEAYDVDWTQYSNEELAQWNWTSVNTDDLTTVPCQFDWSYDNSTFVSTAISEWDLVCDQSWVTEMVPAVYLAGMFVGSLTSGHIADNYGRMNTLVVFLLMLVTSGLGAVFSVHEWMFISCRFFLGWAGRFTSISNVVIAMELVAPNYRSAVVGVSRLFYSTGPLLLAATAYFVRDFRALQLLLVVPLFLLFPIYWLIPESPRWLMSKGRTEDAKQSVLKLASRAKTKIPPALLLEYMFSDDKKNANVSTKSTTRSNDWIRHPLLRKWAGVIGFAHLASMFVYMAVSMNLDHLFGSIYLNTALAALTEIPAILIVLYSLERFGRKCSIQAGLGIAAAGGIVSVVLVLAGVSPVANTVTLILVRGAASAAVCACTTISAELFPSYMRHTAVGMTSTISAFFTIFSPLIAGPLQEVWAPLPSIVFTALCSIAVLLNLILPETLGKPMPETVADAVKLARSGSIVSTTKVEALKSRHMTEKDDLNMFNAPDFYTTEKPDDVIYTVGCNNLGFQPDIFTRL